jgi:hypothetical protein
MARRTPKPTGTATRQVGSAVNTPVLTATATGGSTDTLGNQRVNTYEDGYGRTTGTIGRDQVNIYTDPSGHTTGTIGRRG